MKRNNKGFTLAELLIVVAIIAVLVAIAIPIFGAQLEKSREATDAANIRNAYAEVMTAVVSGKSQSSKTVKLKQQKSGWSNSFDFPSNLKYSNGAAGPAKNGSAKITATESGATSSIKLKK